jgi:hypothetical protein
MFGKKNEEGKKKKKLLQCLLAHREVSSSRTAVFMDEVRIETSR